MIDMCIGTNDNLSFLHKITETSLDVNKLLEIQVKYEELNKKQGADITEFELKSMKDE